MTEADTPNRAMSAENPTEANAWNQPFRGGYGTHGLLLRDWFAGQALTGMCAGGNEAAPEIVATAYRLPPRRRHARRSAKAPEVG